MVVSPHTEKRASKENALRQNKQIEMNANCKIIIVENTEEFKSALTLV
jgi:hypothetical protein